MVPWEPQPHSFPTTHVELTLQGRCRTTCARTSMSPSVINLPLNHRPGDSAGIVNRREPDISSSPVNIAHTTIYSLVPSA